MKFLTPTFIDPHEVYALIQSATIKVIDVTWTMPGASPTGIQHYEAGHLPQAVFFDVEQVADTDNPLPHMMPSPGVFELAMARLGVSEQDNVLLYDTPGCFSAPRLWWMLQVFGHQGNIYMLNGGKPAWINAKLPLETKTLDLQHLPTRYQSHYQAQGVVLREQVLNNLKTQTFILLDARPASRFNGQQPEPREGLSLGHIPKSLNMPWTALLTEDQHYLLPPQALMIEFEKLGLTRQHQPLVTSCGSGMTACILALALTTCGFDNIAVYDGSWAEWGADPQCPVTPVS